jgi:DNA polymerase III delta subunit
MSFFQEKKLIILDLELWIKDTKKTEKIDFILKLLENNIPEWNIILIISIDPDKRSKQYKLLNKLAEVKEFIIKDSSDSTQIIKLKFNGKISDSAIQKLITYKSNNIDKIASEIEKLLITIEYIDVKHITDNIYPELEESIFQFIDDILNKNVIWAKNKLNIILNDTSIYAFYNNLLANLRTNIFIWELKSQRKTPNDIAQILDLWNKKFLINKSYRINFSILKIFYLDLISLDKKMKSWKMIWTEEKDFQLEFENILVKTWL